MEARLPFLTLAGESQGLVLAINSEEPQGLPGSLPGVGGPSASPHTVPKARQVGVTL